MTGDNIASLIYLGVLLIAIGGLFFGTNRPSLGKTLQTALVWGMIFLGFIGVYGIWGDISGNFTRNLDERVTEDSISVARSRDGHFYLTARVNDTPLEFLVDTGASDLVLSKQDAERVGLDLDELAFVGFANTANGRVSIARARLDSFELGAFSDTRVPASVNGGDMNNSLLGMSYLGRFERIEISNDRLTLHR
ncbi:MAG: TIGR02281 family clan AA aspartic protease [Pseudomonadota bacterium]